MSKEEPKYKSKDIELMTALKRRVLENAPDATAAQDAWLFVEKHMKLDDLRLWANETLFPNQVINFGIGSVLTPVTVLSYDVLKNTDEILMLNKVMASVDQSRFYLTPALKASDHGDMHKHIQVLQAEMYIVNPKVILALGHAAYEMAQKLQTYANVREAPEISRLVSGYESDINVAKHEMWEVVQSATQCLRMI